MKQTALIILLLLVMPAVSYPHRSRISHHRSKVLEGTQTESSVRQTGSGEWMVVVSAKDRWFDTGIKAPSGSVLTLRATGVVAWAPPGGRDISSTVGPNGTRPPFPQDSPRFPVPDAGCGSLVMRIGSAVFAVGEARTIEVQNPGTVQLMVNDDYLQDNSGSFEVNIKLIEPPSRDIERVSWIDMRTGQSIPKNAIVGGIELSGVNNGVTLYVCRANYNGSLQPGKFISGYCNIGYGGKEIVFTQYQIAIGSGFWGRPKSGYSGALLGGAEPGRSLYVCRAHFRESRGSQIIDHGQHPGKIVEGRCHFGFGTQELSSDDFEVFYPSLDNGRTLASTPAATVGGYIDVIEMDGSSCQIRIIAGEKLYSGVVSFAHLSELTRQRINSYQDAVAFLNGKYINVTLLNIAPSANDVSNINFDNITNITFPPDKQSKQLAQTWNERNTATETIINLSADILFDFDKSTIRQDAIPTLLRLARLIRQTRSGVIQLNGFTDSIGSDDYNRGLSERRAEAVKEWLVNKGGVDASRLQTRGYGKGHPVAPNTNPDGTDNPLGRQKNRRVEVRVPRS